MTERNNLQALDTGHGTALNEFASVRTTGQDKQGPDIRSFKENTMKLKSLLAILGLAFLGFACTDTDHYPLTGEECAPDDPVLDLSVQQCAKAA